MRLAIPTLSLAFVLAIPLAGCTNPYDPTQRALGGAAIGAGSGALLGGIVGGGRGALTGAVIGGAVGAVGGAATTPQQPGYQQQPRYQQERAYQQEPSYQQQPGYYRQAPPPPNGYYRY